MEANSNPKEVGTRWWILVPVISLAMIDTIDSPASPGNMLHNGIILPAVWPPDCGELTREPMEVPYLLDPPSQIPIDTGRQLFVDDFLVAKTTLTRKFHRPVPYEGNPILRPDQEWEGSGTPQALAIPFSDGVWFDSSENLYKMWYLATVPPGITSEQPEGGLVTCYATSLDGIEWTKPKLDVVPGTNIVHPLPRDSSVVWLDAETNEPTERFVMFRTHRSTDNLWSMSLHISADGIHWSDAISTTGALAWLGDRNSGFFNPFRDVWVYSIRNSIRRDPALVGRRARLYFEHPDPAEGLKLWQRHPWTAADRLDPRHPKLPTFAPQLYALDAVAYESVLLGLFSILEGPENDACARLNIHKRNEILVGFSRDGYHWDRPDRKPFITVNETDGAWNWGNVQSVGGCCLIVGDRLYFYASGRQWSSEGGRGPGSTGLFFLRRDGFASMDALEQPGTLTTRLISFSGRYLFVNANAGQGELRVEVLDEAGQVIAPYALDNCLSITSDSTSQRVRWVSTADLSDLAGRPVRFRFNLRKGCLFAFWVSPDETGASRGYVAAGGPGFTGSRDLPSGF
jgi:hypothetical protein